MSKGYRNKINFITIKNIGLCILIYKNRTKKYEKSEETAFLFEIIDYFNEEKKSKECVEIVISKNEINLLYLSHDKL